MAKLFFPLELLFLGGDPLVPHFACGTFVYQGALPPRTPDSCGGLVGGEAEK